MPKQSKQIPNEKVITVLGFTTGIAIILAFLAGYWARGLFPSNSELFEEVDEGYTLVHETQELLDAFYLREQPDFIQRQYAAIRGLLSALEDPNTFFIEPPVARNESDALSGVYGGIGILLQKNESGAFVLTPFDESPAANASITDGDILLAVNGETLTASSVLDIVQQQLRGEVKLGNGVEVTIQKSTGATETLFIEFAVIQVPSVITRVLPEDNRIGYLQILSFTSRTPGELEQSLTDLLETESIEALVLDLRNNNGGLLQESIAVADQFLTEGIAIFQREKDSEQSFRTHTNGLATEMPLVVLVNDRTASASEILAGAIQDRSRGILIGQQTFGKGTIQQIHPLADGSSLHITSAEWLTPNRRPIAEVGLEPNIAMIPDPNGRDVELGEAIRYLQQTLATEGNING